MITKYLILFILVLILGIEVQLIMLARACDRHAEVTNILIEALKKNEEVS